MTMGFTPPHAEGYLDVAASIARRLRDAAFEHDGRIAWMGTDQEGHGADPSDFSYTTIGVDTYSGTLGVALFLAEVYGRTGEPSFRATAHGGVEYALGQWTRMPHRFRFSFYLGALGGAYALTRVGLLTDREDYLTRARGVLRDLSGGAEEDALLDVISGAAGAITPLLTLARWLNRGDLESLAVRLGERIIAQAIRSDAGWSWTEQATGFHSPRGLTGFAHGAAGMGLALLELYAFSGDDRFLTGASEAFRYEQGLFLPTLDNWPDFRFADGVAQPAPCGLAWCFGSPGIGLSRLRSIEIRPDEQLERDARAAVRSVKRALSSRPSVAHDDFSLCHGWTGVAELLLDAARVLGDGAAAELAIRIADEGRDANAATYSWHSGLVRGSSPSLMLGLAGVGHFYLRLSDARVPSVLLVRPPTPAEARS